jgi:hypothetical protein
MEPTPNSSNNTVNHEALIMELRKMRGIPLEEKEELMDLFGEIIGYHGKSSLVHEEELPSLTPGSPSVAPQEASSQVVDENGKKVFKVSGNGRKLSIRGYKASLPRGSTVIRYRLNVNGKDEPVPGMGHHSQKMGHTKDKIIQKLQAYLGQGAQKYVSRGTRSSRTAPSNSSTTATSSTTSITINELFDYHQYFCQ